MTSLRAWLRILWVTVLDQAPGSFAIKPEWLLGYSNGAMRSPRRGSGRPAHRRSCSKGGRGVCRGTLKPEATATLVKAVAEATEKGDLLLVRRWPGAKRAIEDATEPDAEDDSERPAPVAAEDVRLSRPFEEEQAAAEKAALDKAAASKAYRLGGVIVHAGYCKQVRYGFGMQLGSHEQDVLLTSRTSLTRQVISCSR